MMRANTMTMEDKCGRRRRLVVPIKDLGTRAHFFVWFASNAQFWSDEIRLVTILEPLWFSDIPHSAVQAHLLLEKQEPITARLRQELAGYCQELQVNFPGVCVSCDVIESHINADTIVEYARQWEADSILLLSTRKGAMREFLGNSLAANVLRAADCMVHVVQTPSAPAVPKRTTRQQPSTT